MPGPHGPAFDELYSQLRAIYTSADEPQESRLGQVNTANFSQNLMIRLVTVVRDAMAAALEQNLTGAAPGTAHKTLASLSQQAQGQFNPLSTQIAGGSGNDPIVDSALTPIPSPLAQLANHTA